MFEVNGRLTVNICFVFGYTAGVLYKYFLLVQTLFMSLHPPHTSLALSLSLSSAVSLSFSPVILNVGSLDARLCSLPINPLLSCHS